MHYTSTRDNSARCSFEEAICTGYAPDGGLFVPAHLPKISKADIHRWSTLTYPELAADVLRMFISEKELSTEDLVRLCNDSFKDFENPDEAVVVRRLGDGDFFISELFHGPTMCFKDLGMKFVVNVLSHFCRKRRKRMTLIVSTTGDTGPAAVKSVCDAGNPLLIILVHYPLGQISDFQRKQLTTVDSPRVHVVAFEGGGDDMDAPIKRMLSSQKFKEDSSTTDDDPVLCGVNSYNIGRPLMQMVHFIWTYLRVAQQMGLDPGDSHIKMDAVLPTGAMGNITGGYLAKKIGVPLGTLCAAVNINDITHRTIESGKFHKSEKMQKTLSEAINIQVPYNFERLLYYLTDENSSLVQQWMTTMELTEKLTLDESWHTKLQHDFQSARVTDSEMCTTMKHIRNKFGYLADPHTSVALAASKNLGYDVTAKQHPNQNPVAVFATASPCKFQESVQAAIGEDGWKEYLDSDDFPRKAAELLCKNEISPTVYRWREGASLSEVQQEWEQSSRSILKHKLQ